MIKSHSQQFTGHIAAAKNYTPVRGGDCLPHLTRRVSKQLRSIGLSLCAIFQSVEFPTDTVEYRIRERCARAIAAPDSEWAPILCELKSLIHKHVTRAKTPATPYSNGPMRLN